MDPLVWAIILLAAGLTLAVLELFIPSGGMIGLLSLVSIVGSIWMAFKHGSWTGLGFTSLAVMAVPVVLAAAFKVWPHTRFGRRILLEVPAGDTVRPDSDVRRSLRSLVGKTGVAQSLMTRGRRPGDRCRERRGVDRGGPGGPDCRSSRDARRRSPCHVGPPAVERSAGPADRIAGT